MKTNLLLLLAISIITCCEPSSDGNDADDDIIFPADTLDESDSTIIPEDSSVVPLDTIYGPPDDLTIIDGAIHFYVFGDFGRRGEFGQLELARMMDTVSTVLPPDFIIGTGDNFYPDGVSSTSDPHWKETFEDIYSDKNGLNCPWYMVLGNHDYHIDPQAQIDYTQVSDRWVMKDFFFHEDIERGGVSMRMVFLDTSPFIDELYTQGKFKNKIILQDTAYRLAWMDSLFSDESKNWKIAVGHHPIYSGGDEGNRIRSMKNHVDTHLKDKNVDIFFNGHVHMIYHAESEGTHYITSGSGSKTEEGFDIPEKHYSSSSSAFVIASATKDSIYCQVVNHRGEIEYRTSIQH